MESISKSVKRKIEEGADGKDPKRTRSMKHFFEAPKPKTDRGKLSTKSTEESNLTSTRNAKLAWKWKGTLLHYESSEIKPSAKIASFDFDGTLAKTSIFKHGPNEWSILYPSCIPKLQQLHKDGYKLVIFTNQAGIGRAKASKEKVIAEKTGRLVGFVNKVCLPFQIMVSTSYDSYRKPNAGMWDFVCKHCNCDVEVDKDSSFFVGDAAGRAKDHGSSDKEFAAKCGIKFYTEDDFFLKDTFTSEKK